jgi:hypothetical protein
MSTKAEDWDDGEVLDCPNCGRSYDAADADFLICHHCGPDATTGKTDRRKISGRNRLGIDPDIPGLDDWT